MIIEKFLSDKNGVVTCKIEKSLLFENTYIVLFSYIDRAEYFYKREVKPKYEIGYSTLEVELKSKFENEDEFFEDIKDKIKTLFYQVLNAYRKKTHGNKIEKKYKTLLFNNIYDLKNLENINIIIQDLVKFNIIKSNCDKEIERYFIEEAINAY